MPVQVKIGHYQCTCTHGNYEANFAKVIESLQYARREDIDILSFPSSLLTGYYKEEAKARRHCFTLDGPEIADLLKRTARYPTTFMAGFNERSGDRQYNTVLVAERGKLLGVYRNAFPVKAYWTPGREFPVFRSKGVAFGVQICSDAGYLEPARILALKGARIIFAPHYNFLAGPNLIDHFMRARITHAGCALNNGVYFLRGNQVGKDKLDGYGGRPDLVAYGDSYLLDPRGEVVARAQRYVEEVLSAVITLDDDGPNRLHKLRQSVQLLPLLKDVLSHDPQK